jgi:uncharacterized membrane protein YeaQ/YmgE (transglycosylase-associated protein family)
MSLIVALILGAIIGWLAGKLLGRNEGVIASIVIGIIGSLIGSWISMLFTGSDRAYLSFSWSGLFWSFIGAVVLVAILNAFRRPHNRTTV